VKFIFTRRLVLWLHIIMNVTLRPEYLHSLFIMNDICCRFGFYNTISKGVLVGISALFFFGCNSEVSQSHWSLIDSAHSNVKFNNILKETEELNYFTYPYLYMGGGVAVGVLCVVVCKC